MCVRDSDRFKNNLPFGYLTSDKQADISRCYKTAAFVNTVELAMNYFGLFVFHLIRKAKILINM